MKPNNATYYAGFNLTIIEILIVSWPIADKPLASGEVSFDGIPAVRYKPNKKAYADGNS